MSWRTPEAETYWADPPPRPTIGLPAHVAQMMYREALAQGNTEVLKLVEKSAEQNKLVIPLNIVPAFTDSGILNPKAKDPLKDMKEQLKTERRLRRQGLPWNQDGVVTPKPKPVAALAKTPATPAAAAVAVSRPPAALPPTPVGLLFPGQGSQYVKMMSSLKDIPKVREYIESANRILGYDILAICMTGPEEKLEETSVCQAAMFLAGMAGVESLRATRPEAVERPGAVAGLSLGEYTALCVAGVFTFEEGLELVKIRGKAMEVAAKKKPQLMLSVAGLDQDKLEKLCAAEAKAGEVCKIANVLFPKGFACAGTKKAIEKLKESAEKAGAMQAKVLKTSGAFHTELMKPAQQELEAKLKKMMPSMQPPRCDIYMNVDGKRVKKGTPPSEFVPKLGQQLCSTVLWEPSVRLMIKDGITEFYEVGPMKQLKAMMKRIDQKMWNSTVNVEV